MLYECVGVYTSGVAFILFLPTFTHSAHPVCEWVTTAAPSWDLAPAYMLLWGRMVYGTHLNMKCLLWVWVLHLTVWRNQYGTAKGLSIWIMRVDSHSYTYSCISFICFHSASLRSIRAPLLIFAVRNYLDATLFDKQSFWALTHQLTGNMCVFMQSKWRG